MSPFPEETEKAIEERLDEVGGIDEFRALSNDRFPKWANRVMESTTDDLNEHFDTEGEGFGFVVERNIAMNLGLPKTLQIGTPKGYMVAIYIAEDEDDWVSEATV